MRPNDENGGRPTAERPFRVLVVAGSNRRQYNPELAMKLERSREWEGLSRNHLEGRTAAFFCYGDGGGDELDEDGWPRILRHRNYFDPGSEPYEDMRQTHAPLVWQCHYSGIEVPDHLWCYVEFGEGKTLRQGKGS